MNVGVIVVDIGVGNAKCRSLFLVLFLILMPKTKPVVHSYNIVPDNFYGFAVWILWKDSGGMFPILYNHKGHIMFYVNYDYSEPDPKCPTDILAELKAKVDSQ